MLFSSVLALLAPSQIQMLEKQQNGLFFCWGDIVTVDWLMFLLFSVEKKAFSTKQDSCCFDVIHIVFILFLNSNDLQKTAES